MNQYSIVNLKGGLGNQLFIISFAEFLRKSGYKVLIDTSFYKSSHDYSRKLHLDIDKFGFKEISFKTDKIFKKIKTRFEEVDDIKYLNTRKINFFTGYYQNTYFLDKEYLIKKLAVNNNKNKNSVMVHIRRGDYIKLNEELKLDYYKKSINKIEKKMDNFGISIFSDDYSLKIDDFKNFNVVNIFNDKNSDVLETFKEMVKFQNFIISNSTFSFLAAFLGQQENSEIYYPNPWMRNSDFSIQNIPKNWIQIKNKI